MTAKRILLTLALTILLTACQPGTTRIERHPNPANYMHRLDALPSYNPANYNQWQVDLRSADLSELDLSNALDTLMKASFDSQTRWPAENLMPAGFDWRLIMEMGKNPGLGLRTLHEQGITGKGVGIAIIDATLLVDHIEYIDRLKLYDETWEVSLLDAMSIHGSATASIAVGKNVGAAPGADLYYFATEICFGKDRIDFACLAKTIQHVLDVNNNLPADQKIRVLSISVGWKPGDYGYDEIIAAVNDASKAGIFVVSTTLEQTTGFELWGLGREPLADSDRFEAYMPALSWERLFYAQALPEKMLLVPTDSRTLASPTGLQDYAFYRDGGISWAVPYLAGVYALAAQVDPQVTPEIFLQSAFETGQTVPLQQNGRSYLLGIILDPVALIARLLK